LGLPQVNHIDCDKLNNAEWNLEWCDNEYNQKHAIANGLVKHLNGSTGHGCAITNETDVLKIRELHKQGDMTNRQIGNLFGLSKSHVGFIVRRIIWKHI